MVDNIQCELDRALVNENTLPLMKDFGLSIFASVCGKNRGAFVLHPSDGKTYSCLKLPENILDLVGIHADTSAVSANTTLPVFEITDVNSIKENYKDGNLTAADTVSMLDFLVKNAYESSSSVDKDPYACDVSGLVTLNCSSERSKLPIRAVTMAGVFFPSLWATGGKELTLQEASRFYETEDFNEMKALGLNTVYIPVSVGLFDNDQKNSEDWLKLLNKILNQIREAGLKAILSMQDTKNNSSSLIKQLQNAARFAHDYNNDYGSIISALVLSKADSSLLDAVRTKAPKLDAWVPINGGDFASLNYPLARGASLDFSHTVTVADIASSNSEDDRAKMFYHENMACISRAPLEYSQCMKDVSVMVTNGFDLAVDDCHLQGVSDTFQDFGQCDRFHETVDSRWWKDHRYSFAARQLYAYEQGRGWSFAAWKLWGTDPQQVGVLDVPAKLLSFRDVVAAGVMPSLYQLDFPVTFPLEDQSPVKLACLNPPNADFIMGDATYAPTPAPPPSCGNGWWNFTTAKCDYWIPPITEPPTESPTSAPCPVCSTGGPLFSLLGETSGQTSTSTNNGSSTSSTHFMMLSNAIEVFVPGILLSVLVSLFISRVLGKGNRNGYVEVPEGDIKPFEINV